MKPVLAIQPFPTVMLVSDGSGATVSRLIDLIRRAARSGIPLSVQIREKKLSGEALWRAVRQVMDSLGRLEGSIPVLVNGRLDIALAAGAAGVHLPGDGPPVARVRQAVPAGTLAVGASTHSISEVRGACRDGADYVLFGPVFATPAKAGMGRPQGLERLAEAVSAAEDTPLLAIGGITPLNATACRKVGASGVAVIGALRDADDPAQTLRDLAGEGEPMTNGRDKP